jgi:hypothetical protein
MNSPRCIFVSENNNNKEVKDISSVAVTKEEITTNQIF